MQASSQRKSGSGLLGRVEFILLISNERLCEAASGCCVIAARGVEGTPGSGIPRQHTCLLTQRQTSWGSCLCHGFLVLGNRLHEDPTSSQWLSRFAALNKRNISWVCKSLLSYCASASPCLPLGGLVPCRIPQHSGGLSSPVAVVCTVDIINSCYVYCPSRAANYGGGGWSVDADGTTCRLPLGTF